MTGVALVLAGLVGGAATTGTPAAVAWGPMYGTDTATSNTQGMSGYTGSISVSAVLSGGGTLFYTLNGAFNTYTGAFPVAVGATLAWTITVGHTAKAGNLTVTDATHSTTLATIAYSVDTSWDGTRYR